MCYYEKRGFRVLGWLRGILYCLLPLVLALLTSLLSPFLSHVNSIASRIRCCYHHARIRCYRQQQVLHMLWCALSTVRPRLHRVLDLIEFDTCSGCLGPRIKMTCTPWIARPRCYIYNPVLHAYSDVAAETVEYLILEDSGPITAYLPHLRFAVADRNRYFKDRPVTMFADYLESWSSFQLS